MNNKQSTSTCNGFILALILCCPRIECLNLLNTVTHKIVGLSATGTQHIPQSYVQHFPRWTVTLSSTEDEEAAQLALEPLVSLSNQPFNSEHAEIRPALQILVKSGIPTYVLAGVELRVMNPETTATTPTESSSIFSPWTAQQWISFERIAEPNFRIMLYVGDGDGTDDLLMSSDPNSVRRSLETFSLLLQMPQAATLANGFHIVSLALGGDAWIKFPKIGTEEAAENEQRLITCLGTAEPDAREVLTLDPALVEMTLSSILQIQPIVRSIDVES